MPQTCPTCQSRAADDAAFCQSCGAALSASSTATHAGPAGSGPAPADAAPAADSLGRSAVPAYKFEAARWSLADWIAGIASIVLFFSLLLYWFGISLDGTGITVGQMSGVSAHGFLYIVMIICILEVAYLVLRAGWDELPISGNVPHLTVMLVATIVNLVLVFIAFIDKPAGYGWEFGAFLALIAAVVAAAPYAIPQLRAKTMS
jgi:hypothetical protein